MSLAGGEADAAAREHHGDTIGFWGNALPEEGPVAGLGRAARAGEIPPAGPETPASADSRPPGTRIELGGRCRLLQLELANDNAGGPPGVTFVPPDPFPDPPSVLALIVEQRSAARADVVIEFRHISVSDWGHPGWHWG